MPIFPYVWTQALDGRWETISRWSPTGTPDSRSEDAFITATGANYAVALENYIITVVNGGSTEVRAMELHDLEVGPQATLNVALDGFYLEQNLKANGLVNIAGTSTVYIGTVQGASTAAWSGTGNVFLNNGGTIRGIVGADPTLDLDTRMWITRDNAFQIPAFMKEMSLNIINGSLDVRNGATLHFDGKDFKNFSTVSTKDEGSFLGISAAGTFDNQGTVSVSNSGWIRVDSVDIYNTGLLIAESPNKSSVFVNSLEISGIIDQRSNTGHGISSGVIESNGFGSGVSISKGAVFGGTLRTVDGGWITLDQVTLNGTDQVVTINGKIDVGLGDIVGTVKGVNFPNSVMAIGDLSSNGSTLDSLQVAMDDGSTLSGPGSVTLVNSLITGLGTISAPLVVDMGSSVEAFSFFGTDTLTISSGSTIQNNGKLIASYGGRLVVNDKVVGTGTVTLSDGGDATFLKEFNQSITVDSFGNTKEDIALSFAYSGAIKGMDKGDTIDLIYAASDPGRTATYNGTAFNGTLKISNPDGSLFTSLLLTGDYRNTKFALSPDASGGTLITLTDKTATTIKTPSDFNGDGKSDILLQNSNDGTCYIWNLDGTTLISQGYAGYTPGANWEAKGTGDFNGDGKSDILLQNSSDGTCYIWNLDGTTLISQGYAGYTPGANWEAKGTGDFNGDGKSDILLQNSNDGTCYIWNLDGTTVISQGYAGYTPGANWVAKGTGDFNGDGKSDILLQNSNDGTCYIWNLDGTTVISQGYAGYTPGANWVAKGTGDFNGDGKSDILLQNSNDGTCYIWNLDGTTLISQGYAGYTPGANWEAKGTGDFNGDGKSDILLQNINDGTCYIWNLNGTTVIGQGYAGYTPGAQWEAVA